MKKQIGLRKCLKCNKEFLSNGSGHRICGSKCSSMNRHLRKWDGPQSNADLEAPEFIDPDQERRDELVIYMEKLKDENQELSKM